MNKKMRCIVTAIILLVATSIFIFAIFQRQTRDILLEMIIYPPVLGWGNTYPVYRLVVQNDGTFISYTGIRVDSTWWKERTDWIMWPIVRRRSRITLSEKDFQNISEMAAILSSGQATFLVMHSLQEMTLLHDGNIYLSGLEFYKIADELTRLSPLTSHSPTVTPQLLEIMDRLTPP